jgi:hypothetical protein
MVDSAQMCRPCTRQVHRTLDPARRTRPPRRISKHQREVLLADLGSEAVAIGITKEDHLQLKDREQLVPVPAYQHAQLIGECLPRFSPDAPVRQHLKRKRQRRQARRAPQKYSARSSPAASLLVLIGHVMWLLPVRNVRSVRAVRFGHVRPSGRIRPKASVRSPRYPYPLTVTRCLSDRSRGSDTEAARRTLPRCPWIKSRSQRVPVRPTLRKQRLFST